MPKVGMEPIRRDALVQATIAEIGRAGSLDVTVSQIARRAGVSSALAHHYFGGKEQIFIAAMRHILSVYSREVRTALVGIETPRQRVEAVIRASFAPANFGAEAISAWLNFYVQAQTVPEARRLLSVYQSRLRSNLLAGLRPQLGPQADRAASVIGALIDGLYIRAALGADAPDGDAAAKQVIETMKLILGEPA